MFRIGIELGGEHTAVGIVDDSHHIVAVRETPTVSKNGVDALLDDIAASVKDIIAGSGFALSDCRGVGIGVPGVCDTQSGLVRNANVIGWDCVPVSEKLKQRLGLPVFFSNDTDCAALGEVVAGAAHGFSSALVFTLVTGVGGCFIVDGHIWSGKHGLGGEFGHVCVQMSGGAVCSCGKRGCWEPYASVTGLIRQAREAAQAHPSSALNRAGELSSRSIYAAAASGDVIAQGVTAQYAVYVGVGIVNFINTLYPDVVLLGGDIVADAGDALIKPVLAYVQSHVHVDAVTLPEIRATALGKDAGIIGAAALVR